MKEQFSNEYLKKKIEPIRSQREKDMYGVEDLGYGSLMDHDRKYKSQKESFETVIGETKFSFTYSKPSFQEFAGDILMLDIKELIKNSPLLSKMKDVRRIEKLIIQNNDQVFDITRISEQPSPTVYFNISPSGGSGFSLNANSIFLEEDPLTRSGLVVLSHELGHFNNKIDISFEKIKEYDKSLKKINSSMHMIGLNKPDEQDAEATLREERNAWAFALKILRPFEKDLDLDLRNTQETLHVLCLQSYSDVIRQKIKS